jgi:hypothetical protein
MTVYAPEPAEEPGEDSESHLLPNLERLRAMPAQDREDLHELVRDWIGPKVEQFRERVTALREGREAT